MVSSSAKKVQSGVKLKLIESEERVSLKNSFWKSTLFNDIYLEHDIYRNNPEKWDIDGDPEFESCFNGLLDLFSSWSEEQLSGWTEADTVAHWIKPILVCLGWVDESKSSLPHSDQAAFAVRSGGKLQTYFADILISDTVDDMSIYVDKKLTAEQRLGKAKGRVLIPLEAKYWNRINKQYAGKLNKDEEREKNSKNMDAANRLGPNGQTLKYMEILELEWGMLSDGATWRLFNKQLSSESEGRYLEFNIYNLYKRAKMALDNEKDSIIFREATKFFYNFFSKKALFPKEKKQELVRKALNDSKSYADDVEEDLKDRFVNAMNLVCNGLQKAAEKNTDIDLIRTVAENHLFNILFVKSCEARGILPLDAGAYWDVSLSRMIDALHSYDPDDYNKSPQSVIKVLDEAYYWFEFEENGYELFDAIIKLSKMIHKGSNGSGKGFHIDGFMESVFSKEEWRFAKSTKLTNIVMVKTLFELGFAKAPRGSQRKFQEIPYQYFIPRQLGSIYESFLEYKLDKAPYDMAYVKKQWKKANLKSEKVKGMKVPKVKSGELFFTPDNKDRKATGSYYTPDYIVKDIIKKSLDDLCRDKSSEEILDIKVCDPAMGSGHFINGALNYLTLKYIEALEEETLDDINLTPEEAKRIVLDKCIFGIDINPRAVKLACMSLWLESAHSGKKLERLDDQLFCGDTLELREEFPFELPKLSAIIGNPPYGIDFDSIEKKCIFSEYEDYSKRLDSFQLFLEKIYSHPLFVTGHDFSLGLIIPNTFLTLDAFISSRKKILSKYDVVSVTNFDYQVFDDATVDSCIVVCKNGFKKSALRYRLCSSPKDIHKIPWEELNKKDVLESKRSKLIVGSRGSVFDNVETKLVNYFDICTGVKAYQVGKGTPKQTPQMRDEKVYSSKEKIDKAYLPFLYGRDIKAFSLSWQTGEYIKYGKNLAEPKEERYHFQERIFIQRIRNPKLKQRMVAALSSGNEIASAGLSIVVPKNEEVKEKVSLKALTLYLNLPVVNDWYSANFKDVNVKPTQIREVPLDLSWIACGTYLDEAYEEVIAALEKDSSIEKVIADINENFISSIGLAESLAA